MRALAAVVIAVAGGLLAGSASDASVRGTPPYECGYCLFDVSLPGGMMKIVWSNPRVTSVDDVSPALQALTYTRADPTGGTGVYVANLDGSDAQRVATGAGGRWSPDGSWIVYAHTRAASALCAGSALWVVRADGTDDHAVTNDCATLPAWAPDSRRVASFSVTGLNADLGTLTIADVGGGNSRTVATTQAPRHIAWSPRGDRIALTVLPDAQPASGHGVSAGGPHELTTPAVEVITPDGGHVATLARSQRAVWTPRGDAFAFSHVDVARTNGYETREYRESLRFVSADGRRVRTLRQRCCGRVQWLPDGRLAYVAVGAAPNGRGGTSQIFVARRDGSQPQQVTHLLPGGVIDGYWFALDGTHVYVLWTFTDVDR